MICEELQKTGIGRASVKNDNGADTAGDGGKRRFGLGDHLHLGLSWGAMNVELNNDQGIISDRDQYHYLYGVSAGFRF